MARIVLGVIAGFFGWLIVWFGSETILSAISPEWFGAHQAAFQSAIENDGPFAPDPIILLIHCFLASIVSLLSGFVAAVVAGENIRAPLLLGFLLLAMGLLKAAMSWRIVPVWYHVIFTAILLTMAVLGGKVKSDS
jgi:hypothetical protein